MALAILEISLNQAGVRKLLCFLLIFFTAVLHSLIIWIHYDAQLNKERISVQRVSRI